MKHLLLVLVLVVTGHCINAQSTFEKRLEFELKDGYESETVIEFGKNGFLLRSVSEEDMDDKYEWKFDRYDTDLELVRTVNIFLERRMYINATYNTKTMSHMLFRDKSGRFNMVSVDASSLEITRVQGMLPKGFYPGNMVITGDFAYVLGRIKRSSCLLAMNWRTGETKVIPVNIAGYKPKQLGFDHFEVLENTGEVFLFVKARIKKLYKTYAVILGPNGEKKDVFDLSGSLGRSTVKVTVSNTGDDRYIYTGTYSSTKANASHASEGLFFCEVNEGKVNFANYYNFLDLKNFLSYLPDRKQEKIEKKKARKKKRGEEMKLNYLIAAHEVMVVDDGYLFLGEAYYPTYRTETTTTYVNGKPTTTTRSVFDGYQYTHAVLAKFSRKGDLVWDQSFEMWPYYKPFYAKKFISASISNEGIDMVFASYNRIISKSVGFDGAVLADSRSNELELSYEGDKARYTFTNLDYWYDNYFIAHGTQTIKNKTDDNVKRKRKVLFITKLKY